MKLKQQKVKIPAHVGILEGQIAIPDGKKDKESNSFALLFLHPHPLYGGTMSNNVIRALYKHAIKLGIPSLRFNFRGVGNSSGEYSGKLGEIIDAWDALHYLWKFVEFNNVGIIGYSFGAAIGGALLGDKYLSIFPESGNSEIKIDTRIALDLRRHISFYAGISYPSVLIPAYTDALTSPSHSKDLNDIKKLFIMGTRDDFTPLSHFLKFYEMVIPPKSKEIIEGADHFWMGMEQILVNVIFEFLNKIL